MFKQSPCLNMFLVFKRRVSASGSNIDICLFNHLERPRRLNCLSISPAQLWLEDALRSDEVPKKWSSPHWLWILSVCKLRAIRGARAAPPVDLSAGRALAKSQASKSGQVETLPILVSFVLCA